MYESMDYQMEFVSSLEMPGVPSDKLHLKKLEHLSVFRAGLGPKERPGKISHKRHYMRV